MKLLTATALCLLTLTGLAQDYRWQQRVEYTMNVALNHGTNILNGTQKLVYYNTSGDTLTKVYYHLFFNAFQPGSMMGTRSSTINHPDRRIGTRISNLGDSETAYQRTNPLK